MSIIVQVQKAIYLVKQSDALGIITLTIEDELPLNASAKQFDPRGLSTTRAVRIMKDERTHVGITCVEIVVSNALGFVSEVPAAVWAQVRWGEDDDWQPPMPIGDSIMSLSHEMQAAVRYVAEAMYETHKHS